VANAITPTKGEDSLASMSESELFDYLASITDSRASATLESEDGSQRVEATLLPVPPPSTLFHGVSLRKTEISIVGKLHERCEEGTLIQELDKHRPATPPDLVISASFKSDDSAEGMPALLAMASHSVGSSAETTLTAEMSEEDLLSYVAELSHPACEPADAEVAACTAAAHAPEEAVAVVAEDHPANLRQRVRKLAYQRFAEEERAHLEETDGQDLLLMRKGDGDAQAEKVIEHMIKMKWSTLGLVGQSWYEERAKWEAKSFLCTARPAPRCPRSSPTPCLA